MLLFVVKDITVDLQLSSTPMCMEVVHLINYACINTLRRHLWKKTIEVNVSMIALWQNWKFGISAAWGFLVHSWEQKTMSTATVKPRSIAHTWNLHSTASISETFQTKMSPF